MRAVVIVECVTCRKRRDVEAGEIPKGDVPLCDDCYMPMVAVRAETRRGVGAGAPNANAKEDRGWRA